MGLLAGLCLGFQRNGKVKQVLAVLRGPDTCCQHTTSLREGAQIIRRPAGFLNHGGLFRNDAAFGPA